MIPRLNFNGNWKMPETTNSHGIGSPGPTSSAMGLAWSRCLWNECRRSSMTVALPWSRRSEEKVPSMTAKEVERMTKRQLAQEFGLIAD